MAKINQCSLVELVEKSQGYKTAVDFVAEHSRPFSGQNSFLILHGNIKDLLVSASNNKKAEEIPPTNVSMPKFSTAPGNDTDDADTKYIASVFSSSSIVYEILWHMCLHPDVGRSLKISVGRSKNNDIVLMNQHVSKHHGDFILVKEEKSFSFFYTDDFSHNHTFIRPPDIPCPALSDLPEDQSKYEIRPGIEVPLAVRSEISIGPFTFTFYSAEDMYNRVLRIIKMGGQ